MINIKLTKQVQYLRKKFLSENKTQIKIFTRKNAKIMYVKSHQEKKSK